MEFFKNRQDAGLHLAQRLSSQNWSNACVLGLPRGGIPVAIEVAKKLALPLDLLIVKKIGAPLQPEYAIGAIAEDDKPLWNPEAFDFVPTTPEEKELLVAPLRRKIQHQRDLWRPHPRVNLEGKNIILVDDGLATGFTMKAAIHFLRTKNVAAIVVAVPVAPLSIKTEIQALCDQLIVLKTPTVFSAVGEWYENFSQVEDDTVTELLHHYDELLPLEKMIAIPTPKGPLDGHLYRPAKPRGLVLFAHGSGSSHRSPRNQKVAQSLNKIGFATLLFDLLTLTEESHRTNVFNIDLLSERLLMATDWARRQPEVAGLAIAYFGASTGAAAALVAAAKDQSIVSVISRGGRPDLAVDHFKDIQCPTLLIVGGEDKDVLHLNRESKLRLRNSSLVVIPGATHLFEEPGTMDQVVQQVSTWLLRVYRQKEASYREEIGFISVDHTASRP